MRVKLLQPQGSVLVLALFILLIIGTTVGVLTAIVINQLHSVTNYSRSYIVRASAETGVERGLYYAQLARQTKTLGVKDTASLLNTLNGALSNGSAYTVNATADTTVISTTLPVNATVQYDVFDEDSTSGNLQLVGLTDLGSLGFDWNYDAACTSSTPQLEISTYRWEANRWTDLTDIANLTSDNASRHIVGCIIPEGGSSCQYGYGVSGPYLYRVRVKALNCQAMVTISAHNHNLTNNNINLHSQLNITGTANFATANQSIIASALWHPPINDYLDYVIFSDETIMK